MLKFKLLGIYAKDYFFLAITITFLALYLLGINGVGALNILLWFKFIVSIIGLFIHQKRKAKGIFFYLNNGVGEKFLLLNTLFLDLLIYAISVFVTIKFLL